MEELQKEIELEEQQLWQTKLDLIERLDQLLTTLEEKVQLLKLCDKQSGNNL